jgi:hypothetical protein
MPYLVKKHITALNSEGLSFDHMPDTVLSDFELNEFARGQVAAGVDWYRQRLEPLTEREAEHKRIKATTLDGRRMVDGKEVDAPFPDYVGLHPSEITARMRTLGREQIEMVRAFERGGLNRGAIVDFVGPAEQEPWQGYSELGIREVIDKMAILDDATISEVIVYEMDHMRRPAIIQWERETYESDASEAEGLATA